MTVAVEPADSATLIQPANGGAQRLDQTPPTAKPVTADNGGAPSIKGRSLAVPPLSSLPSAPVKLYLDFDGQTSIRWGSWAGFGGNVTGDIPAFDTDGDPTNFSTNELNQIRQIWGIVSGKFSPFNVNVTTVDPGQLQDKKSLKIVIGGDGKWYGKGGGVSIVGGFTGNYLDNNKIGFVWDGQGGAGGGDVRYVGEAAAPRIRPHLRAPAPQRLFRSRQPVEYMPGFVMGRGDEGLGVWSVGDRGDYPWSLLAHAEILQNVGVQDDVAIISGSNNGFGFRPDEAGSTAGTAASMTLTDANNQQSVSNGVITTPSDVDAWRFNWSGGALSLSVQLPPLGAMLNASLELRDSNFNLITTAATDSQAETITTNLPFAGTYYAVVKSRGQYGDIGSYSVLAEVNQLADNTLHTSTHFGRFGDTGGVFQVTSPFEGHGHFGNFVGSSDPFDFYSFDTGPDGGMFSASLTGLSGDADLTLIRDYNNDGIVNGNDVLAFSTNSGSTPEAIGPIRLSPDTRYYLEVNSFQVPTRTTTSIASWTRPATRPALRGRLWSRATWEAAGGSTRTTTTSTQPTSTIITALAPTTSAT